MLIEKVVDILKNDYKCHTIILYGSYVTGDFTDESDLDVLGFSDIEETVNETGKVNGVPLDAWIYPSDEMKVTEDFLRLYDSRVLLDERDLSKGFLDGIKALYDKGTPPISDNQKKFIKAWLSKMIGRAEKGDPEGLYRFHWLITESLAMYFELMNRWYMGPKKSLKWLEYNQKHVYDLYKAALMGQIDDVKRWINYILDEV